ncbi:Msc3p LALA0_S04e05688g [Lachancea lanzarotensis]|uniref:LALA0S04e05688g1_1 n=1 Tax=Lachancea lanzarotensis TaxID=1245769 RepID=A0A0C7MWN8_9SACH|nr:uncharacterized protein LALA0_S04e05688g [Lachancea lanzarotensis]CEP62011.1 LALA0S04e05688g1_1 [Lachancea lanzarotensis]
MGLGINKKPSRVPDLSRYDYHYQNKNENDTGFRLSAAAAAASTGGRSQSLVHSRNPVHARPETANHRSHSLRHNGKSERVGSLTNRTQSQRPVSSAPGIPSSRSNSMVTVHTTEVRDFSGRTHSITKKTVRRVNGYEYVETTTTTTNSKPLGPAQDSDRHFNEFTTDLSHDLDSNYDHHLNNRVSDTLREEDNEDDDNNIDIDDASFSDAIDYLPQRQSPENRLPTTLPRKVRRQEKQPFKKVAVTKQQEKPKKVLTEQEIYAKALIAARKKVYGETGSDAEKVDGYASPQAPARMSSLREAPPAVIPEERKKRRSFSLKMLAQKQAQPESAMVPDYRSSEKTRTTLRGQPPTTTHNSTKGHSMTNEEIHLKAVQLAREKYLAGETAPPTQMSTTDAQNDTLREAPKAKDAYTTPAEDAHTRPAEDVNTRPAGSGSKVKNFFNKVAQFSQENYGYQNKNGKRPGAGTRSESGASREVSQPNNDRQSVAMDANLEKRAVLREDQFHDKVNSVVEPGTDSPANTEAVPGAIENGVMSVQRSVSVERDVPGIARPAPPEVLEVESQESEVLPVTNLDGPLASTDFQTARSDQIETPPVPLTSTGMEPEEQLSLPATHENQTQPKASTLASSVSSSQANFSRQSVRGSLAGKRQELQQPKPAGGSINEVPEATTVKTSQSSTKKPNFLQKLFKRSSRKTKQNH